MSPPTYAPSAGKTRGRRARVDAHAEVGRATGRGSRATAMMNGATPTGSGSMPSASCVIVALPARATS